jgi:hypothetical protein
VCRIWCGEGITGFLKFFQIFYFGYCLDLIEVVTGGCFFMDVKAFQCV